MIAIGSAMLLFPTAMMPGWPWRLYTLTSQAIGAWGVGIGVIAIQASWENDWWRLFPFMLSYGLYGALQIINLLRYPAALDWSAYPAGIYAGFMVIMFLTGAYGTWAAWRVTSEQGDIKTHA